jgi:hypothetical protein
MRYFVAVDRLCESCTPYLSQSIPLAARRTFLSLSFAIAFDGLAPSSTSKSAGSPGRAVDDRREEKAQLVDESLLEEQAIRFAAAFEHQFPHAELRRELVEYWSESQNASGSAARGCS